MSTQTQCVTKNRLTQLRAVMALHQADAYIIPSTDEHLNEYLPANRERRAFISGFKGSMGDCLVTADSAWVFVDSRYYEQADKEVDATLIQVNKLGLQHTLGLNQQLKHYLQQSEAPKTVTIDPFSVSAEQGNTIKQIVQSCHGKLMTPQSNWVDEIWDSQPEQVLSEVMALPVTVTGQSVQEKIETLQQQLIAAQIDLLPVTKLDQVAWLLNLRGQDIPYNPLFTAYMLIQPETVILFCNTERFTMEALAQCPPSVQIRPYSDYVSTLSEVAQNAKTWLAPRQTSLGTHNIVVSTHGTVETIAVHPIDALKMIKNTTEIHYMSLANGKASRAKIRALYWLEQEIAQGRVVTEAGFAKQLEALYSSEEGFAGLSFNTISATGSNGSIVHYGTPDPEKVLQEGDLFLIDSGCQFIGGTTDDTRTVLIGEKATDLQKERYTAVLKAHIAAASQQFPAGTNGTVIDAITRSALWNAGLDYGHGTGHGVGAFLNVHEGPNGIHRLAKTAFVPNMVNSIEPGFYEAGWGGIRLENLYRVIPCQSPESSVAVLEDTAWLTFENLTYIPFDKKLIDWELLTQRELRWLKSYYDVILSTLKLTLPANEQTWLEQCCEIPNLEN